MARHAVICHIVYEDGREEEVRLKPKAWLAMERKFGTNVPPREAAMFGAWVQLNPGVDFEAWVESLDFFQDRYEALDPPPPPPPSASPESP